MSDIGRKEKLMLNVFYCKQCVFPSTRPHITFNEEGVCSACTGAVAKKQFNWDAAREDFKALTIGAKSERAAYDCVIPVSGGKDSIYQVVKAKQYGLNILAVNVDYGIKTDEGIHNLNIISDKLGVDVLTFKPGNYHKKLIRIGFLEYGDPDVFSHALLYSYPVSVARQKKIPVVLFGENPAVEYLGNSRINSHIDDDWFFTNVINKKFWNDFWINRRFSLDVVNILENYTMGRNNDYHKVYFMGDYFYWDSKKHAEIADALGFRKPEHVPGTYRNWVGIDEVIHRVHQYMKVVKFGYGRATDHACEDVREGKIDREEAIRLANWDDDGIPNSIILKFCSYIDISVSEFYFIVDKFRNENFWKINTEQHEWQLDRNFNIFYKGV